MTEPADPYFVLLGIAQGPRPPSHYELLGVAEGERDLDAISAAADAQLSRVSKFLTGASAQAAQRLIGEIATAKAVLTTPAARSQYDAQRRKVQSPAGNSKSASAGATPPARSSTTTTPPLPPKAVSTKQSARPRTPPAPVARPNADGAPKRTAKPAVAAPRLVTPPKGVAAAPAASGAPREAVPVLVSDTAVRPSRDRRTLSRDRRLSWLQIGSLACLVGAASLAAGAAWKWRNSTNEPRRAASANSRSSAASPDRAPPPSSNAAPTNATAQPPPNDAPAPTNNASPQPEGDPVEPLPSNTTPEMTTTPAPVETPVALPEMSAERTQQVSLALAAAREALAQRDMAAAAEQLDLAAVSASGRVLADVEVARIAQQRVERFWNAVDGGTRGLAAGEEIMLDGKPVAIVEAGEDRLVIRIAGKNEAFSRDTMPVALAMLLAHRSLTRDLAERSLCDGAFLLFDAAGDAAEGRKMLETAAASGSDEAAKILAAFAPPDAATAR